MRSRVLLAAAVSTFTLSLVYAARSAYRWTTQELSPFHRYLDRMEIELPPEARVLVVAPDSARYDPQVTQLATRLHPRPVYVLPPGVETLEGARAWIAEKRLTWAISLGRGAFDPAKAWVRSLDGPH
jgi:hypothetical protein